MHFMCLLLTCTFTAFSQYMYIYVSFIRMNSSHILWTSYIYLNEINILLFQFDYVMSSYSEQSTELNIVINISRGTSMDSLLSWTHAGNSWYSNYVKIPAKHGERDYLNYFFYYSLRLGNAFKGVETQGEKIGRGSPLRISLQNAFQIIFHFFTSLKKIGTGVPSTLVIQMGQGKGSIHVRPIQIGWYRP